MAGGQRLHAADPGDDLDVEDHGAARRHLVDHPQRAVVQRRIAPHEQRTALPVVELVADEPLVDVDPLLVPGLHGGAVRLHRGGRARDPRSRRPGRAPRCSDRRSGGARATRSLVSAPLSSTKNTSASLRARTAWTVTCSGSPAPMPMIETFLTGGSASSTGQCEHLAVSRPARPTTDQPVRSCGALPSADVPPVHPLLDAGVRGEIERAASCHLGRRWVGDAFTDLDHRASHPCGVLHGEPFSVFAKLGLAANAGPQFSGGAGRPDLVATAGTDRHADTDRAGRRRSRARFAAAVRGGVGAAARGSHGRRLEIDRPHARRPAPACTTSGSGSISSTASSVRSPQDNRRVPSNRWADFYAERRVAPLVRSAVDSGHLPAGPAAGVDRLLRRLPELCGPEPRPTLLHGDAQQNNFVSAPAGAMVVDAAPYFGHPEIDLALDRLLPAGTRRRVRTPIATSRRSTPASQQRRELLADLRLPRGDHRRRRLAVRSPVRQPARRCR